MELWLTILLLILLGCVLRLFHGFYLNWYKGQEPPGPWGLPVLGNLLQLDAQAPHKSLQKLAHCYGGIMALRMGRVRTIVLSDAALVREFFRHEELTARAPLYLTHGIMGGNGIICAEGLLWKQQRRHIIDWLKTLGMTRRSGWTREQLERRIGRGVDECVLLYEEEMRTPAQIFDPLPALQHTLGNIINDLVFGLTYARDDVTWRYLQQLQEEGVKLIGVSGVVNFLPILRFLPSNRRTIRFLLEGKAQTHELYDRIIKECEQKLEKEQKLGQKPSRVVDDQQLEGKAEPMSILELFLRERAHRKADEQDIVFHNASQLRHLLADLFGAGVDTSLATLRWFLLYMAREQDCQRQLRKQLLSFGVKPTIAELESLPYLRACLAEVQRIRSVVPLGIPHGARRDVTIAGYRIAKGSMIIPLQWAIHMDSRTWTVPEEFRPQRFLNADGEFVAPPHFIPFQTGKRMCPGDELARMMLILFAGRILRRFQLSLAGEVDMEGQCGITLSPKDYELQFAIVPVHYHE
ncbi:cytochrome P450 306a1 [Scaptodrosophila lebanonensis]|uniref:Cytochrome P450 306a1 n=1 Tax=Drosophila lebanonensis TaxID=7225 RepID=A0A6J2U0R3_DROLE|nr:cytochrome P450 306a1 [Scaptodrosophila lebanonensis]